MTTKKTFRKALSSSLKSEAESVKNRFELAESVLTQKNAQPIEPEPEPEPVKPATTARSEARVIRDTFSITAVDYELIPAIKKRCMRAGIDTNKSEILRAGLIALSQMTDEQLEAAMSEVERVKPGRPLVNNGNYKK